MEQQEMDLWLEDRKKYITGSDITFIANYLVYGNETTYGKSIYQFTMDKQYPKEFSSYTKAMFKTGHLEEAGVVSELREKYGDSNVTHEDSYIKDFIRTTQDAQLRVDDYACIIYEIKTVRSMSIYRQYKDGTHPNMFQVCAQLYCNNKAREAVVVVIPVNNLETERFEFILNRDSNAYLKFLSLLPTLKDIYTSYMKGEEYFKLEPTVSDDISAIVEDLENVKKEIYRLEILKKEKEELIKSYLDISGESKFNARNSKTDEYVYTVTKMQREKIVVDEIYKSIHAKTMKHYKDIASNEFIERYPDSLRKEVIEYIIVKENKK